MHGEVGSARLLCHLLYAASGTTSLAIGATLQAKGAKLPPTLRTRSLADVAFSGPDPAGLRTRMRTDDATIGPPCAAPTKSRSVLPADLGEHVGSEHHHALSGGHSLDQRQRNRPRTHWSIGSGQ